MTLQSCPNCRSRNDVAVYVHGQETRCPKCGLRFFVDRENEAPRRTPTPAPPAAAVPVPGDLKTDVERPAGPAGVAPALAPPLAVPAPGVPPEVINGVQANPDMRPLIPGYEVLSLLGKGGMGEVWKARQQSLKRFVAVKVLSPTLAVEPDFVRRFERESSALAALGHATIVQVFDRGSANGHWYFTMEYVEGRTLRDKHAESPLSRTDALKVMAQVARAIDYAHQKHVIHRDLKPENILLDAQNNAKVADFGLANMRESGVSSLTMTRVAMGTAQYMAPEQNVDAKNVDFRADLYSLGVMLYELLTNEVPRGRFKSPKERVPDLDPRLDDIIMQLMDRDPERRPKRALEVAAAIDNSLVGPRVGGPIDVSMNMRPRFDPIRQGGKRRSAKTRHRWLGAGMALALLAAVATWWLWPTTKRQPLRASLVTNGSQTSVTFGSGDAGLFSALGAGWRSSPEGLERVAVKDADRDERAYLSRPLTVDGTVELEVESGSAKGEGAEVVLVTHPDEFVGIRLAEGKARLIGTVAPGTKSFDVLLDSNLRAHRVLLVSDGTRLTSSVDGRVVGTVLLPDPRAAHFLGVGCTGARCLFTAWKIGSELGEASKSALQAAVDR